MGIVPAGISCYNNEEHSQHTSMRTLKRFVIPATLTASLLAGTAGAFFDEIVALQEELQVWETANAADFSDVIEQLDDITGPVFRDVGEDAWFNPYVASLAEWGIVSGYKNAQGKSTGEFRPANNVTVAEVLKMSMEAAKVDVGSCTNVPLHPQATGHWAKPYVACAEALGVRMFDPMHPADLNRPAKRAEVVTVVLDVFHDEVLPLYATFKDTNGHPYEADIAYANLYGIVSGDKNAQGAEVGTFRPEDSINRAETSKIIYERLKLDVLADASIQ